MGCVLQSASPARDKAKGSTPATPNTPAVDYRRSTSKDSSHSSENTINRQENKSHYRTMTKTRKYMIDGQVVTTTATKIVMTGEENKSREEHELR